MKKGKRTYATYQKKGETGREYIGEDIELDIEAAERCWPNFKTFYARFKYHPSLDPGAVEDSLTPSPSTNVVSRNVFGDEPEDADTPEHSRPLSRSVADSESEGDEDDVLVPCSKKKNGDDTCTCCQSGTEERKRDCGHAIPTCYGRHARKFVGKADAT